MPITLWGNPILDRRSLDVGDADFGSGLAALCARMLQVMYADHGAGLAAPQVGIPKRLFVYDCDGERGMIANPVIVERSADLQEDEEGCLSVPGFRWPTARAMAVTVKGQDAYGQPISLASDGYLARCFQHEIDHLDGRLYLSRLGGNLGRRARAAALSADWFGEPSRFVAIA
jgi:peptide deformylase